MSQIYTTEISVEIVSCKSRSLSVEFDFNKIPIAVFAAFKVFIFQQLQELRQSTKARCDCVVDIGVRLLSVDFLIFQSNVEILQRKCH